MFLLIFRDVFEIWHLTFSHATKEDIKQRILQGEGIKLAMLNGSRTVYPNNKTEPQYFLTERHCKLKPARAC